MRKIGFLLVSIPFFLFAAPCGSSASCQLLEEGFFISRNSCVDFRLGYEADFVQDGLLQQVYEGSGRVDTFHQITNSTVLTLNLFDRFDLFSGVGSSFLSASWRFTSTPQVQQAVIETFNRPLWFVGGRGIVVENGAVALGILGRFSSARYAPSLFTIDAVIESLSSARIEWRSWQAGMDLSYKTDLLTPYLGMKYSRSYARLSSFSQEISNAAQTSNQFQTRQPWGIFLGCTLSTGKLCMVNLEARLIDEEAWTASLDLRF